jgi:hypothetical protein
MTRLIFSAVLVATVCVPFRGKADVGDGGLHLCKQVFAGIFFEIFGSA